MSRSADPNSEFSQVLQYIEEAGEPVSLPQICRATRLNQQKVSRILWHFTKNKKVKRTGKPKEYKYSL